MASDYDKQTPAFLKGVEDAIGLKPHKVPRGFDPFLYMEGYRHGQNQIGVPFDEAAQHEPAHPLVDSRDAEEKDAARHGYEEARDLMPQDPHIGYTAAQRLAYINAYHRGMMEKVDAGDIPINRARELMGYSEYVEVVADTPQPQFDPVKIPSHYNSGKIEVTNFIADQELNFPRGNVVKYVARAGKKDPATELQDLEKAAAYLQMAYNIAQGKPAVVRDPETKEVVWTLFKN